MRRIVLTRTTRFALAGTVWIAMALVFSLIYWGMWQNRPDSFIVNKEFNFDPFEALRVRLWNSEVTQPSYIGSSVQAPIATELDSLMSAVVEIDKAASALESMLVPLRKQQAELESRSSIALQRHSEALWRNVEKYKATSVATEKQDREKQEAFVTALENQWGPNPPSHQAVVLAEARVNLAQMRLLEVTKEAEVGRHVLTNLGSFSDPATLAETESLQSKLKENLRQQNSLSSQLSALRRNASDTLDAWRNARQDRMQWIDFFYFSVGASTSTTFGDIIEPPWFPRRLFGLSQPTTAVV